MKLVQIVVMAGCVLAVACAQAEAAQPAKLDRVVLLDVHGLWGGADLWISGDGSGWCRIVRGPKPGEAGLMEMLYRVKLSAVELAALSELVTKHDPASIQTKDRSGGADEGRPTIYVSAGGKEAAVQKWSNDKNDDFDAHRASLTKIAEAAKATAQVRWGPFNPQWAPDGFPNAATIRALAEAQRDARDKLSEAEQKTLLTMAREQLVRTVKDGRMSALDVKAYAWEITPKLQADGAVFVTLKNGDALRGCIGDIVARQPLCLSVLTNALNAARLDPRFAGDRINEAELPKIDIEISYLTPPKPVGSWKQIVIGKHGVLMECRGSRAVFLPQVAVEQHWDLDTMLRELSMKAGLAEDVYKDKDSKFQVFQAQVFGEKEFKAKE